MVDGAVTAATRWAHMTPLWPFMNAASCAPTYCNAFLTLLIESVKLNLRNKFNLNLRFVMS